MLIVICRSAADPTGRALPSSRRRVIEIPLVTLVAGAYIVEAQKNNNIAHKGRALAPLAFGSRILRKAISISDTAVAAVKSGCGLLSFTLLRRR
jgi:hypothetical protein